MMQFVVRIADDDAVPSQLSVTLVMMVPGRDGVPVCVEYDAEGRFAAAALPLDVDGARHADELGNDLLELVAPKGSIARDVWDLATKHATEFVLDVQSPNARRAPWELLGDTTWRPFRRREVSAVRGTWPLLQPAYASPDVPVHVLVVVGDIDDDTLGHEELAAVYRGLDESSAEWYAHYLHKPTRSRFREACAKIGPQVLHVVGGSSASDGGFAIRMRPEDDAEHWLLHRDVLNEDVKDVEAGVPRIVVLSGSHTGSNDGSFTEALIEAGSSAVIAMTGEVDHKANLEFIAALYHGMASGQRIDRAVALARAELWQHSPDWARARLTVAMDPRLVVDFKHGTIKKGTPTGTRPFVKMGRLVDRVADRARLNKILAGKDRLVAVFGDGVDHVDVARSCLLTAIANGHVAVHVNLGADPNKDVTDDRFHELVMKSVGQWAPAFASSAPPRNEVNLDGLAKLEGGRAESGYAKALTCLPLAKAGSRVVLFLEDLSSIHNGDEFREHFLDRIPQDDPVTVQVVLIEKRSWFEDNNIDNYEPVRVTPLYTRDCVAHTRECLSRHRRRALEEFEDDSEKLGKQRAKWDNEICPTLLRWAEEQAAQAAEDAPFSMATLYSEARAILKHGGFDPYLLEGG
jgi:hypothetical protein